MKFKSLTLACLLLFTSTTISTAEEIGRAAVNGRSVIIDSNGTWVYADAVPAGTSGTLACPGYAFKSRRLPLLSCLPKGWELATTPLPGMEIQAHHADAGLYTGFVTEPIELTIPALRRAIITNAANGAGVRPEDIIVKSENAETFGDHKWNYIELDVTFSGSNFRFGNFYTGLAGGGSAQMVFWSSPNFFDKNKGLMTDIMKLTKFDK
jgi:hypothetical protein